MADNFAFKVNDLVQFKDGRNMRTGVVLAQHAPDEEHTVPGYTILFLIPEASNGNGQNRAIWWDAASVSAAQLTYKFKAGDSVKVDFERGQSGKIVKVAPMNKDNLQPSYAVQYDENDPAAIAWWQESVLVAA